jgi:hypothetical protein
MQISTLKKIIEALGGRVEIIARLGRGCLVTFIVGIVAPGMILAGIYRWIWS